MRTIDADAVPWIVADVGEIPVITKEEIDSMPTVKAEPEHGHWEETKVVDVEDCYIDQLQSARCSVCGRYHTAPYMYSWAHYDFCPHCGAKMERK